jgi:hypothetical protein
MFVQFLTSDGLVWLCIRKIVSVRKAHRTLGECIVFMDNGSEFRIKKDPEEVVKIIEGKNKDVQDH